MVADLDQRALQIHLEAAERGHPWSVYRLAISFYKGKMAVKKDMVRAEKLAVAACKMGSLHAHLVLGTTYFNEAEGDHLLEKAKKHLSFAAKNGESMAMDALQKMSKFGKISEADLNEIEDAFKEASKVEWSDEREAFAAFVQESGGHSVLQNSNWW
jgi:TPR repeat protein